ncbi:MAG: four helix bundle protein, partial [Candidatus Daviesbacteria bacterium]|nr:four helix bundle protein [Candidatus Daviesbacteria bacterium]
KVSEVSKVRDKTEKGYHKLLIWQRLKEFIKLVYALTEKLPKSEEFGLKSQMRRAIVSVISNFVEGYLKFSIKHKKSFMEIANTSLLELEAQAEICRILEYWTEDEYSKFEQKRGEVAYLLYRYMSKLE